MLTCLDEKERSREEATSLEGLLSFRSIRILQVPIHNIYISKYHLIVRKTEAKGKMV